MALAEGYAIHHKLFSDETIEQILKELSSSETGHSIHGIRQAERKFQSIAKLVNLSPLQHLLSQVFARQPHLVRTILFDKPVGKNWSVGWHQDKSIAVNMKQDLPGWGPWVKKEGVWHVQPQKHILENMVTVRVHLDNASTQNGCLRVIPKSHTAGILSESEVLKIKSSMSAVNCVVSAGDAVVMRPLLLHSSQKSRSLEPRRVIHMEFSDIRLPKGLKWLQR